MCRRREEVQQAIKSRRYSMQSGPWLAADVSILIRRRQVPKRKMTLRFRRDSASTRYLTSSTIVGQPLLRIGGRDGPAAIIVDRFLGPIAAPFAHDRYRHLLARTEPDVSQYKRDAPIYTQPHSVRLPSTHDSLRGVS
jgi:hypothetical protein